MLMEMCLFLPPFLVHHLLGRSGPPAGGADGGARLLMDGPGGGGGGGGWGWSSINVSSSISLISRSVYANTVCIYKFFATAK